MGLRAAVVSEDDPNNLILATESGVIVITDLGSEIQVNYNAMQYIEHYCVTTLHCTTFHYIALHSTALYCTTLSFTSLHQNSLHCTKLH